MTIWSAEIKDLQSVFESIKGQFPDLEKELVKLVKADDENMILLYSRRCLEVIITDLCECELGRPRKTEPLKGIIDKLNKEEKVPSNIITSMLNLNSLSAYGAHPKDFDPEQVKPVLNNLTTIIKWYLKYKDIQVISKPKEQVKDDTIDPDDSNEDSGKPTKRLIYLISGLAVVIVIVVVALFIFDIIGSDKQNKELEKSIAVIPFHNLSGDPGQEYISDGLTDEIINHLFKIKSFDKVVSLGSVLTYKGTGKKIPEIADELNVNYILEGTYKNLGEQVRVSAQLIEAKNDRHIWQNNYDGSSQEIIAIQTDIALKIVSELKAELSSKELHQVEKQPTENLQAYDFYLQGRYHYNKRTMEGLRLSMEYFEKTIDLDPGYALAYAGLADTYHVAGEWNYLPAEVASRNAMEYAQKALSLDSSIAEPYATLASYAGIFERDSRKADSLFTIALRLNPNYATAHQWYALLLTSTSQFDEAKNHINQALRLDPLSAIIHYAGGLIYYWIRDYDKALSLYKELLKLDPEFPVEANFDKFLCYYQKGLMKEAVEEYQKGLVNLQSREEHNERANNIIDSSGMSGYLNFIIELELMKDDPSTKNLALLYALSGNNIKALDYIEHNYNEFVSDYYLLNIEPAFDNLRSEPRFIELVKKLGFDE